MTEIAGEIGKQRNIGQLLKTGQTTQYSGYEDDGYFETGLSTLYTVLTLRQYAATTDITLNGKTDVHSNNCVYYQRTKLTWSRYYSASLGPTSNGMVPWTTNASGEGIFAYAAAANLAKLGGYSDWRIPNITELLSLANIEATTAKPNAIAFPGWAANITIWSSTTRADLTTSALFITHSVPYIYFDAKTNSSRVILVRGG